MPFIRGLDSIDRRQSRHGVQLAKKRLLMESLEPRQMLSVTVPDDNWQNGGGGSLDLNTQLVWSQPSVITTGATNNQAGSNSWANNLVEGGKSDWRLPTKAELEEAAVHGLFNHDDLAATTALLWSSTKGTAKNDFWAVRLSDPFSMSIGKASSIGAIAVRGTRAVTAHTTPDVRVFSQLLGTSEWGGAAWFTLALDKAPTANVTIPIASNDPTEGAAAVGSVVFTPQNWNVPQWVKVTGVDDALLDGSQSFVVQLGAAQSADPNYNGLDPDDVTVVNADNDVAGVVLAYPSSGAFATSETGGTTGVAVTLTAAPSSGPVYVQLSSSDATEGAVPLAPLVFDATNWNIPQLATITGLADGIADGDVTFNVQASAAAGSAVEFLGVASNVLQLTNADVDGTVSTYASGTLNKTIPDLGSYTSTINVPAGATIGDLNVTVNVATKYPSHLKLTLIGPDGRTVTLVNRRGLGTGHNFTATIFDDEAQQSIATGAAPFTGSYRPDAGSLSQWDGLAAGGAWKLKAEDVIVHFTGTLLNWSLQIRAIGSAPAAAAPSPSQLASAAAAVDAAFGNDDNVPQKKVRRLRIA